MSVVLRSLVFALVLIGCAGLADASTVDISINKTTQQMTVMVDGSQRYVWAVSTGAPGYDTPSGSFRPLSMEKDHYSREWDDAPMPNAMFFTGRGHAIHGSTHVGGLGRRVSHGCIRLAPANAARLYSLVEEAGLQNTRIVVRGGTSDPDFLTPRAGKNGKANNAFWSKGVRFW